MRLTLNRKYRKPDYTIGQLMVDGVFFCDTLEPTDRNLSEASTLNEVRQAKSKGTTAIPTGTYRIDVNTVSPRLGKRRPYSQMGGCIPRLKDVKGYDGILIHIGNWPSDTKGCILVGRNLKKGMVLNSTQAYRALTDMMFQSPEGITITIK